MDPENIIIALIIILGLAAIILPNLPRGEDE